VGSPDQLYSFHVDTISRMKIMLSPLSSAWATYLSIRTSCYDDSTTVAYNSGGAGSKVEFTANPGTTYYIVVDGCSSTEFGSFSLTLLAAKSWVGNILLFTTTTGNTNGGAINYPNCEGLTNSPNNSYFFTLGSMKNIRFSLCGGSTWDTDLSLYSLNQSNIMLCNDDYCGLQSEISAPNLPRGDYLVVVGSGGNSSGPYSLFVTTY